MRRILLSATIWLLLLGNLAYFIWAQGALAPLGFGKSDQGEPQRLARQISPERIVILPAEAANEAQATSPALGAASTSSANASSSGVSHEVAQVLAATSPPTAEAIAQLQRTPASAPVAVSSAPAGSTPGEKGVTVAANGPVQCLQSPPLDTKALAEVRRSLETQWPAGTWKITSVSKPGRWLVYMGKYPNDAILEKKQDELKTLKVRYFPIKNQDLAPGISLGEFDSLDKAKQALQNLNKSGIRTAKVVQESASKVSHVAIVPAVNPKLRPLVDALQTKLGTSLQHCDRDIPR
jgi:hypothetical protein